METLVPEPCVRHPTRTYETWCMSCELPLCNCCSEEHGYHNILDIKSALAHYKQQNRKKLIRVKNVILPTSLALLYLIKSEKHMVESHQIKISNIQKYMVDKAMNLKYQIDRELHNQKSKVIYLKTNLQHMRREMTSQIFCLQQYEKRYELSENRPVQFLLLPKKIPAPKTTCISATLTLTKEINIEDVLDVIESLGEIQITETGKRKVGGGRLLKMCTDLSKKSFWLKSVRFVDHISCVTSNRMWVSDDNNLILTDKRGNTLRHLTDIDSDINSNGLHTVTSDGDLIYIDKDLTINKVVTGIKTDFILMNKTESWKPRCVFCSPFNGDLLVGMKRQDANEGKVNRYNSTGKLIQSITYDMKCRNLYKIPTYITENHNGDVIVSDLGLEAVVVTNQYGRRRFSYRGPPSGPTLSPRGICTDAFLHIIVCDCNTRTVQMIDKNGHFLEWLRTEEDGISIPCGLGYDDKNHHLWVGSWNSNTVCVYRYIQTQNLLTDIHPCIH